MDKKITIDTKATILLSEFLGNNLSKIKNEIEKLLIIVKKNHITPQLIEKHIELTMITIYLNYKMRLVKKIIKKLAK